MTGCDTLARRASSFCDAIPDNGERVAIGEPQISIGLPIDRAYRIAYNKAMSDHVKTLVASFIGRFDSQTQAAAAAGVSQPALSEALKLGRVGPRLALGIDAATNGEIPKRELRPDLWSEPSEAA